MPERSLLLSSLLLSAAAVIRGIVEPLFNAVSGWFQGMVLTAQGALAGIQDMVEKVQVALGVIADNVQKARDLIGSVTGAPQLGRLDTYASGGVVSGLFGTSRVALMGEQGPELVRLPSGSEVFSAREIVADPPGE